MSKPIENERFLPTDACPALMTKTMALNTHYQPSEFEARAQSNVAIFYCLKTMQNFGPDNDDACPESCRPGRGCWLGEAPQS